MSTAIVSGLYVYPVKSCRGLAIEQTVLTATGLHLDRHWMIVDLNGRFISQREAPAMALITPVWVDDALCLDAPGMPRLNVNVGHAGALVEVSVWRDQCAALDEGSEAAAWVSSYLGRAVRLVRFAPNGKRASNRAWTGDAEALTEFADGYALLVLSQASLDDLNARLATPLPMNRFRPNVVLTGLDAYDEDRIHELSAGHSRLRIVKPCTRCKITTVEQSTGTVAGEEPLRTLMTYRLDRALSGVTFGQNAIVVDGVGEELRLGQIFDVSWKS